MQKYYPSLDGIRTFCIVLTVCHHSRFKPPFINGEVGVDVFFALSGYLITMLLLRERDKSGTIDIKGFYIRRIFRIVPLYFLTIALYFPATSAAYFVNGETKGLFNYVNALPWLLSFNSELRVEDAGRLFGHAWTLGIEEKFYVFWPLAFVFIVSIGKRALFFLPLLLLFLPSHMMFRGYVGIVSGVTLALLVEQGYWKPFMNRVPTWYWLVPLAAAYLITLNVELKHLNILMSISSAFLIASLVQHPDSAVSKFLSLPPLPFLGVLTYALYLIHRLTGHVVEEGMDRIHIHNFYLETALVYAVSVVVAYGLHRAIEQPFIRMGRRISHARRERVERPDI